jgi:hypothetical protein
MISLLAVTVGWALEPTRIMRTDSGTGNSLHDGCISMPEPAARPMPHLRGSGVPLSITSRQSPLMRALS